MSLPATMRAVQYSAFNQPLASVTLPTPAPAKGEVLVKTAAAAINPIDFKVRASVCRPWCLCGWVDRGRGKTARASQRARSFLLTHPHRQLRDGMLPRPIARVPCVPGADVAGTVVAVGPGVTGFAANDRVYGIKNATAPLGTLAEFVSVPVSGLVKTPASLTDAQAAALPLAGLTALQALDAARVAEGDAVLITAAAGGVGSLAVQLATARGARVVGTCGPANLDFVTSLGATPLDYTRGPLAANAPAGVIPEGGFDAVIDVMGGAVEDEVYALTKKTGRFQSVLNSGTSLVAIVKRKARSLLGRGPAYGVTILNVGRASEGLRGFNDLLAANKLKPIVAEPLRKLDDAEQAFADLKAGHTRGKIVFEV